MRLGEFARKFNLNAWSLAASLVLVNAWTLWRFITQASTFDLVTQQLVARSWAQGNFSSVSFGTTNYLLKLIFLYLPLDKLPGSPRAKLIVLTMLINTVTFFLLYKLIKRILAEFKLAGGLVGPALVWLAAIAGSVFWMQYANSRNLEVVGGVYLLYLGLKFMRAPSRWLGAWIAVFASLLFFSDSLQIFMVALPAAIYLLVWQFKDGRWRRVLGLACLLVAGWVGSKLIFWGFHELLNINFIGAGSFLNHPSLAQLPTALRHALSATSYIFTGGGELGWAREAVNVLFAGGAVVAFVWLSLKRRIPARLSSLVVTFFVIDEAIYIASGQAINTGTSRYLIMLAPIAVLGLAALVSSAKARRLVIYAAVVVFLANFGRLGWALDKQWPTRFSADAHLKVTAQYLIQTRAQLAYASMDTALPTTYYKYTTAQLVPLACNGHKLQLAKSLPASNQTAKSGNVPIVLDQLAIKNVPSVCDQNSIIEQLGEPLSTQQLSDGSLVLVYPAQHLQNL